jgi:DNA polymerase-3 subunit delta'
MSFTSLVGNERNKEILKRLLKRGRLDGTYIFAGPDGVGKRQFALTLAKAANCERPTEDSCDQCPSCHRIDGETHSDVKTIRPDGNYLKIAQARALAEEIQFRPREGRRRFVIIDEAERLREEAANALLKTLEEPPADATIILITSRPAGLLQTILSRAQRINFTALSTAEMESYLAANYRRPTTDTALLARITEGRIGQATAIDLSEYRRERREMIGLLELLAAGNDRYRLLKAAEYYAKQERDVFEKKLDLLMRLLRDLFLLAVGRSREEIINLDEGERLAALAARLESDRVLGWIEKFNTLRSRLVININRQIALEALLINIDSPSSSASP